MRPLPSALVDRLADDGHALTILVVRLGAMGDILRTLPAVRLLRRAVPSARLVWALDSHWRRLLADHPDVDDIIEFPRKDWDRWLRTPAGWLRLPRAVAHLRRRLRGDGVDLAIDFHGNLRSGVVTRLSGARVRIGYDGHQQKEGNRLFTTHHRAAGDQRTSRVRRNLELVAAVGIPADHIPRTELPMRRSGEARAEAILDGRTTGVLSPGASPSQAYKKPPPALLAAACRALAGRRIDALVVHGPGEEADARRVAEIAGPSARLAPPTDLETLAALLGRARVFVGGDSGPLHMACALGCPVVGVYGPTDPRVNEPWSPAWRAVHPPDRVYTGIKRIDRRAGGFAGLAPGDVAAAVEDLLDSLPAG